MRTRSPVLRQQRSDSQAGRDHRSTYDNGPRRLKRHRDWGMLAIGLAIGVKLVEGTQDNMFSSARVEEFAGFLAAHGTPWPMFSAHLSAYA